MSYDPKASRPDTDETEEDAPVDRLLGAEPAASPETAAPVPPGPVQPLPESVPTKRTVAAAVAAAVAVVIVLVGWRRRRR